MCLCKKRLLFFVIILFSSFSYGTEITYTTFSISYHSWVEKMTLDNGTFSENAWATLAGTGIHIERQTYWNRTGINAELGLLFGAGSAGGSSVAISYTAPKTNYYGVEGSLKLEKRLTPQISMAAGPLMLYRNISWDTTSVPGLKADSGAQFNLGLIGQVSLRLSPAWDLQQEIGALAFNATTYWQLGFGYKF